MRLVSAGVFTGEKMIAIVSGRREEKREKTMTIATRDESVCKNQRYPGMREKNAYGSS